MASSFGKPTRISERFPTPNCSLSVRNTDVQLFSCLILPALQAAEVTVAVVFTQEASAAVSARGTREFDVNQALAEGLVAALAVRAF